MVQTDPGEGAFIIRSKSECRSERCNEALSGAQTYGVNY